MLKHNDINEEMLNREYENNFSMLLTIYNRLADSFGIDREFLAEFKNVKDLPINQQLNHLFNYIKDEPLINEDQVQIFCNNIINLFWLVPALDTINVEWKYWENTVTGCIVRTAQAKLKYSKGEEMSGPEVALITGKSLETINRATRSKELIGTQGTGKKYWSYDPKDVRDYYEKIK